MKENVLDVLIYLFENCVIDHDAKQPDQESLALALRHAGFERRMIDRAFNWLENLAKLCEQDADPRADTDTITLRLYTEIETERLGKPARTLLLKLEQCGVLNTITREMVIDQTMALGGDIIDLDHLKWVTLMVLSNYREGEGMTELTESLVLDERHTCIH